MGLSGTVGEREEKGGDLVTELLERGEGAREVPGRKLGERCGENLGDREGEGDTAMLLKVFLSFFGFLSCLSFFVPPSRATTSPFSFFSFMKEWKSQEEGRWKIIQKVSNNDTSNPTIKRKAFFS